jgi:hypothetical protein
MYKYANKVINKIKNNHLTKIIDIFPNNYLEWGMYHELKTGGFFDAEWYQLAYGMSKKNFRENLLDYIRVGIPIERDPNPYFNTVLYRRAHDVELQEAFLDFARSESDQTYGAYRNENALLKAQHNYKIQTRTELSKKLDTSPRPYAIFLQSGEGSIWYDWQPEEIRSWDLIINHYDESHRNKIPCEIEFHQTGKLPGTKFTSFQNILENYFDLLAPYKFIALLDDDIQFENGDLTKLFKIVDSHGWHLAQASLSRESNCSYPVFFNREGSYRFVNGVEVMMPVISRSILPDIRDLIAQSISGWGFDTALSIFAKERGWKAVVIDEIIAHHLKPINADIGNYYKMLHRAGIFPEIEFTHLQKKYGFRQPLFFDI